MGSLGDLNVSIGADLAPLESAVSSASNTLQTFAGNTTDALNQVSKSIATLDTQLSELYATQAKLTEGGEGWNFINAQIDQTIQQITALENSEAGLALQQQQLTNFTRENANAQQQLSTEYQTSQGRVIGLDSSLSRLSLGLATGHVNAFALSSVVSQMTKEFQAAQAATGSATSAFGALGNSLLQPELLIFAAATGLALLVDHLLSASKHTDEFTKAQQDEKDAINGAIGKAAEESAQLGVLAGIAANTALSTQQRITAVNELQSKYGDYLGNISKEAILTGNVADALKRANAEILNKALAEASAGAISKYATQLADINQQIAQSTIELASAKAKLGDKVGGTDFGAGAEAANDAYVRIKNNLDDLIIQQKEYTGKINDSIKATQNYTQLAIQGTDKVGQAYAELQNKLDEINKRQQATGGNLDKDRITATKEAINQLLKDGVDPLDGGIQKLVSNVKALGGSFDEHISGVKIDKISEALKKLKNDIVAIQTIGQLNGTSLIKIDEEQITRIEQTIKTLLEDGLSQNSLQIKTLKLKIQDLQFEIDPIGQNKFQKLVDQFARDQNGKGNPGTPENTGLADLEKLYAVTDQLTKQLNDKLLADHKKRLDAQKKDDQTYIKDEAKFYSALGGEIKGVFENTFTTLLTTGKLSFDGLAQSMEKLLANLAATAAEAAVLSLILSTITGGSSIASTLGATSTGFLSIFKALIPHAEGGIFTGPTIIGGHIFGERGPEALVPLNGNLGKIGGNQQGFTDGQIVSRIDGNDIVLVFNRQNKYNNRNFGNFTR